MLNGFPKEIKTAKLGRGHYRIDREDSLSITVRRTQSGSWDWVGTPRGEATLSSWKMLMAYGYMAIDQLEETVQPPLKRKEDDDYRAN